MNTISRRATWRMVWQWHVLVGPQTRTCTHRSRPAPVAKLLLPTSPPQKGSSPSRSKHAHRTRTCNLGDGTVVALSWSDLRPGRATTVLALLPLPTASACTPPFQKKEQPKQIRHACRTRTCDWGDGTVVAPPRLTSDQDVLPRFSPCSHCQLPHLAPPFPENQPKQIKARAPNLDMQLEVMERQSHVLV
jgi:hypothetical protein